MAYPRINGGTMQDIGGAYEAPREWTVDHRAAVVGLIVDGYRFAAAYARMLERLDAGEQRRYGAPHRFFMGQLETRAKEAGLKLVDITGLPFDPGIAATPLNSADFGLADRLIVDQMLEPVILNRDGSVLHTGTILLRKISV
jgi:hypothetical protein